MRQRQEDQQKRGLLTVLLHTQLCPELQEILMYQSTRDHPNNINVLERSNLEHYYLLFHSYFYLSVIVFRTTAQSCAKR